MIFARMNIQLMMAVIVFWPLIAAFIATTQRSATPSMRIDFYDQTCPNAEKIIFAEVQKILRRPEFKNVPAQLLRLFFHDCFIGGCDASVLIDTHRASDEKEAAPNQTLKGFEIIDVIKEALERECPGIVSCSDILVLATRDAMSLSGGPFYPLYTGRRDSKVSFWQKATFEIPRPTDHIDKILRLFAQRGFTARETVALLGGHSIGFISCAFIRDRIDKVDNATDPYIPQDFHDELSRRCQNRNNNVSMMDPEQLSSSSSPLRSRFGTHYYESLTRRRGLLFSDMELMAHEQTAAVVEEYASDDDGSTFRRDFITALVKMSNLVTLTGSQGEVRLNCSVPLNS